MAITKEQIFQTADAIATNGQTPTLANVRKALGGGSYTTISEAMSEWKATQGSTGDAPLRELTPAVITGELEKLAAQIWAIANNEANRKIQAEREALEIMRGELETQQNEAAKMADQMAAEIEQLQAQLEAANAENGKLRQALALAERDILVEKARYTEQEKRIIDAREDMKRTQDKLQEVENRERAALERAATAAAMGEKPAIAEKPTNTKRKKSPTE